MTLPQLRSLSQVVGAGGRQMDPSEWPRRVFATSGLGRSRCFSVGESMFQVLLHVPCSMFHGRDLPCSMFHTFSSRFCSSDETRCCESSVVRSRRSRRYPCLSRRTTDTTADHLRPQKRLPKRTTMKHPNIETPKAISGSEGRRHHCKHVQTPKAQLGHL